MVAFCPTITVESLDDYENQLTTAVTLSKRIHIDLSDGTMAPRRLLGIGQVYWPKNVRADLHLMAKNPSADVLLALELKPNLVILHAEAQGDFVELAEKLRNAGIKVGVALLQQTSPAIIQPVLSYIDHVLVFSGNLGYQGGSFADLALLPKVKWLKEIAPAIEIGWDGGASDLNAKSLADAGVDVINVGGYLQRSEDPSLAYAKLKKELENKHA